MYNGFGFKKGHWTPFFYSSTLISMFAPFLKAAACQGRLFARSRRKVRSLTLLSCSSTILVMPELLLISILFIIITRSYAALRAADLEWIVGPGYSLGRYIFEKKIKNQPGTIKNQPGTMKTDLEP